MKNFDAERFEYLAERFVSRGIFVTVGGGGIRVMAREAAKFFGLPYQAMLTALGGNTEAWFKYFYLAGGFSQDQNHGDASGFGRFLSRNW